MTTSRVTAVHNDWLTLVDPVGPWLTLPVLRRVWPAGPDRTPAEMRAELRSRLAELDLGDPAARTAWIERLFGAVLAWGPRLAGRPGRAVPETLVHVVAEHAMVLRPDYAPMGPAASADAGPDRPVASAAGGSNPASAASTDAEPDRAGVAAAGGPDPAGVAAAGGPDPAGAAITEAPRVLVTLHPPGTGLTERVPGERWSASPVERLALLCRATGTPIGIACDGDRLAVVWAPSGSASGSATFPSTLFAEEPGLLDAFRSVLGADRFFAVADGDRLEQLFAESASAQAEVTGKLGDQVRAAAELVVGAISRADREGGGALLAGVDPERVYEGAVTFLMRLVVALFAEERLLLPLGRRPL